LLEIFVPIARAPVKNMIEINAPITPYSIEVAAASSLRNLAIESFRMRPSLSRRILAQIRGRFLYLVRKKREQAAISRTCVATAFPASIRPMSETVPRRPARFPV
jgi:hypothetical protein